MDEALAELRSQADTVKYIYQQALRGLPEAMVRDEVLARAWMLVVVKTQFSAVAACVDLLREDEPRAAARLERMEMELRGLLPDIEQYGNEARP